jgi:hypothetical protein
MATLGSTGKTDPRQFDGKRKLLLVPLLPVPPAMNDDHGDLLDRHWESVESQINNLEKSLGTVSSVFHEMLYGDGDQAESMLQQISPRSFPVVKKITESSGSLKATEDPDVLMEITDWQRCMSIGLMSQAAYQLIAEKYQTLSQSRFEKIGEVIDKELEENSVGLVFIAEDHRVQFASDIQVFYVSPPTHNDLKVAIQTYIENQNAYVPSEENVEDQVQEDDK